MTAVKPNELYDAWKAKPDKHTLTPLISSLTPVINSAIGAYGYAGDPNIRNVARIMTIDALPKYDPSRAALDTFVFGELRRLQREGPKHEEAIPLPERVALGRLELDRTTADMAAEYGREPTDDEIRDKLGLSAKRLRTLRGIGNRRIGELRDEQGNPVYAAEDEMDDSELWRDLVVSSLGTTDRQIYSWMSGVNGKRLSTAEVASRLRISPPAVSQRVAKIMAKMAEGDKLRI
jgi:DNA-directed RNA polymerase specialized sigma subunit